MLQMLLVAKLVRRSWNLQDNNWTHLNRNHRRRIMLSVGTIEDTCWFRYTRINVCYCMRAFANVSSIQLQCWMFIWSSRTTLLDPGIVSEESRVQLRSADMFPRCRFIWFVIGVVPAPRGLMFSHLYRSRVDVYTIAWLAYITRTCALHWCNQKAVDCIWKHM